MEANQVAERPFEELNYDIVIEDNLCEDNSQRSDQAWTGGIWLDESNRVIIQRNVLREHGVGMYVTGCTDVIVRNNVIYSNNKTVGSSP